MTNLQSAIREILNREDIEGLLEIGAPADEYSIEAELISQAIENGQVELQNEKLYELLREIWHKMFGPFSEEEIKKRQSAFERVARQLAATSLNGPTQ